MKQSEFIPAAAGLALLIIRANIHRFFFFRPISINMLKSPRGAVKIYTSIKKHRHLSLLTYPARTRTRESRTLRLRDETEPRWGEKNFIPYVRAVKVGIFVEMFV